MDVEIVEYTEPGCSWAWGTEPKLRLLRWRYGDRVRWRRVMGGLVEDMSRRRPDFDPERAAPPTIEYWAGVSEFTGMPYPARLQYVGRSTVPACLAVKAAERQSEEIAQRVLRRLREQTFVFGCPPDTPARIAAAVARVPGLDVARFTDEWATDETRAAYQADWEETRRPNRYVLDLDDDSTGNGMAKEDDGHRRYAFPTVIVRGPGGEETAPGWQPYARYEAALERVAPGTTGGARRDPTPAEVFTHWGTAAPTEIEQLCGTDAPLPSDVVEWDWGAGTFLLSRDEAEARHLAEIASGRP